MKPRKFQNNGSIRASCEMTDDGPVVDVGVDMYDDKAAVPELRRFARWLLRAADWLEGKEPKDDIS